jgi:hypothetical protein
VPTRERRATGRQRGRKGVGESVKAGSRAVRSRLAALIWLVAVIYLVVGKVLDRIIRP